MRWFGAISGALCVHALALWLLARGAAPVMPQSRAEVAIAMTILPPRERPSPEAEPQVPAAEPPPETRRPPVRRSRDVPPPAPDSAGPPPATAPGSAAASPPSRPPPAGSQTVSAPPSRVRPPPAGARPAPARLPAGAPVPAGGAAPSGAPTASPPAPAGAPAPVDLFPRSVLSQGAPVAPADPGGLTINARNRAQIDAERAARHQQDVAERDRRWEAERDARLQTRQGRIDPRWREFERQLTGSFKPPIAALHDEPTGKAARLADRAETFLRQVGAAWLRGEDGLRKGVVPGSRAVDSPPGWSIDPSVQGYPGDPPGLQRTAMATAQALAVQQSWDDPAHPLSVIVELETSATGDIVRAEVIASSGRKPLDRFAVQSVREHLAAALRSPGALPPGAIISRWRCDAAYSVKAPRSLSGTFDENALFDRKARKNNTLRLPLTSEVQAHVSLEFVRPAP